MLFCCQNKTKEQTIIKNKHENLWWNNRNYGSCNLGPVFLFCQKKIEHDLSLNGDIYLCNSVVHSNYVWNVQFDEELVRQLAINGIQTEFDIIV
jgi:hypothetical protein